MKTKARLVFLGVCILFCTGSVFGQGAAVIIKERAKELRDQNNVRQGVPTPAAPLPGAQPATAGVPAKPLTPQEQAVARLQADLTAMRPDAQPSIAQKLQLGRDMMAVVQAPTKPSSLPVNKMARDIADVLGDKLFATVTIHRLAQDLNTVLNPSTVSGTRFGAVVEDLQAIFQANNVDRKDAVAIAADANAVAAEIKKAAAAAPAGQ